jgi:4,5-DOPA dioxygenase extradiol
MHTTERPAALFVPHGAPTFALRPGAAGAALRAAADRWPRPRAIVAVSAHWETSEPTVGFATRPSTIHDFSGFPRELYALTYPASGCPEAGAEVADALQAAGLRVVRDPARGLDHGAWVPLRLMYPDADVPIVPLSVQPHAGAAHAYRVGRALAPLAAHGLQVIASGNVTHNLGDYFRAAAGGGTSPAYVREFADWLAGRLAARDVEALLAWRTRAPAAARAHPTEEHLLPLFVALGAAGAHGAIERLHAGIDDYVLAMDAYAFARAPDLDPDRLTSPTPELA